MFNESARKAIKAALQEQWEEAVFWNEKIIQINPEDIDALVRCARAHLELGNPSDAKKLLKDALVLDSLHPVANRLNSDYITSPGQNRNKDINTLTKHQIFVEEPGKTKVVALVNLADRNTIVKVRCGDPTNLLARGHKISVTTISDEYIGRLPDDLSIRLAQFITKGNKYLSYIKTVGVSEVKVFIREHHKTPELSNCVSFPATRPFSKT